jgi:hypothetical protein
MRLHVAEKKLEEDKVLLNAILEKVCISFFNNIKRLM